MFFFFFLLPIASFGKIPDLPLANSKNKQKRYFQVFLILELIINHVVIKYACLAAKGKINKDVCFNQDNYISSLF